MSHVHCRRHVLAALCAAVALACAATSGADAATRKPAKARPAEPVLPEATPEQLAAADLVFYGRYACAFDQVIDIAADPQHRGYVDVKHGKSAYRMKPVLSTTGAVRLEDVKGATLMVQIASKSMLMDVKAGRRLVDDCISPRQRDLKDEAARAKAAESAASAASAASGPESAPPAASGPSAQPASAPAPGASDSGPIAR